MSVVVVYNGETIPNILGKYKITETYENIGFSCNFIVKSDSAANLVTACNNLESKFREPFENLTLTFGGAAHYSFSHGNNTCLNSEVSIQKTGSNEDTETSRIYSFSFRAQLPADKSGFNFRRRGDFSIQKDTSERHTVVFSLEYTASPSPSKTSEENFDDFAETYATGVLTSLLSGKSFELIKVQKNTDHEQKITTGSLVYQEIFEAQDASATDNAKIKNQVVNYSLSRSQKIGVSSGGYIAIPQTIVNISYNAELVKSQFSSNDEVHAFWNNTLKTHVVNRAITNLNLENVSDKIGISFIILDDNFRFDPSTYKLSASIVFLAPNSLSAIIELREEIRESWDSGIITRKLWDGEDFTKVAYHQGADLFIVRTTSVVQINARPSFPSILPQENVILKSRVRTGVITEENTNSEVGNSGVKYFAESFLEVYERTELVNEVQIQIPVTTFAGE